MKMIIATKSVDYEIKRQKGIGREFGCEFIRTDPDKEGCKISMKSLRLEIKSDNTLKSKAIKYIAKKILPYYE